MSAPFSALSHLPNDRSNRGKRHALVFVVGGVVCDILSRRATVSSIFRYIRNRIDWLREVAHHPEAGVISRAHVNEIWCPTWLLAYASLLT